jgi:hypothetical protein
MSNPNYRTNVPRNPSDLIDLGVKILKKHTELGDDSPLNAMVSHKWSDNGAKVEEAAALDKQAQDLKRQSEEAINKRNALLPDIENSVKGSRDLLEGVYRETPRMLAQFGFDITEAVHAAAKKTSENK